MNFWTGLILGIIIGWLVEWIIDWLFWRRDIGVAPEEAQLAEQRAAERDHDWQERLVAAEEDYHSRLAAVEEEWRARLDLNEQQWQSQFSVVEADRVALRAQVTDAAALSTLAVAGVVAVAGEVDDEKLDVDDEKLDVDDEKLDVDDEKLDVDDEKLDVDDEKLDVDDEKLDVDDEGRVLTGIEGVVIDGDAFVADEAPDERVTDEFVAPLPQPVDAVLVAEDEFAAGYNPPPAEFADAAKNEIPAEVSYDTGDLAPFVAVAATTRLDVDDLPPAAPPRDDLTRVRGIGPRYAALLAGHGIATYDDLAAADPEQVRAIINPGPMQQINFTSWAAQASAFAATRSTVAGDDLQALEGIGPAYARRLNDRGVTTFTQLAETDEATLADIISAPAWRRINFASWITQARLAAAGDEAGLRELQANLYRREGDNLSLIRGVGQRSAAGLRAAGLDTFTALAAASPEQVEAAVKAAGGRGGDYAAWIAEAGQRAAGRRVARPTRRAKAAYVVPCPQDLSAVPGIGTVFEQRLYTAGIGSYWELAELPAEEIERILGARPGGVNIATIKTAAMQLAATSNSIGRAWDGTPPDDFEEVGGIGEIYERRLYEAGICTFAALAATSPERLAEVCQAPHLRGADYAAWIAHAAELAAARSG